LLERLKVGGLRNDELHLLGENLLLIHECSVIKVTALD